MVCKEQSLPELSIKDYTCTILAQVSSIKCAISFYGPDKCFTVLEIQYSNCKRWMIDIKKWSVFFCFCFFVSIILYFTKYSVLVTPIIYYISAWPYFIVIHRELLWILIYFNHHLKLICYYNQTFLSYCIKDIDPSLMNLSCFT